MATKPPKRPVQRLITNTTTECLWPYVLALLRGGPVYAYQIREMVKGRFGFEVGQVAAYMVLYKLESDGYVKTEWKNVENRQRKYYRITPDGQKVLKEAVKHLNDTAAKLQE